MRPAKSERRPTSDAHDRGWEPHGVDREVDAWRNLHDARLAANPRRFPMPEHPKITLRKGQSQCRWCGEAITTAYAYQRSWHQHAKGDVRDCKWEWMSHTNLDYQTALLIERDGCGCRVCPPGTGRWVDAGQMWAPRSADSPGNLIRWSDKLEVDHVVELWEVANLSDDERREYFGLENLWLLCTKHHKAKSAWKAAQRAAAR